MQFYSFDLRDPIFEICGLKLSFQIVTLENIYGLDPEHTTVTDLAPDFWRRIECKRLSWAGQQQHAAGEMVIWVDCADDGTLSLRTQASAPEKIRCIKILIRDLPELRILDIIDQERPVPYEGVLDKYPNPLRLPLLFARQPDGTTLGVQYLDIECCPKRFAVYQERMGALKGTYTIECIFEEDARKFRQTSETTPRCIIGQNVDVEQFRNQLLGFYEQYRLLSPWESRQDMPTWAHDIRLCLNIHGMHWSGYTFNTYDQMLDIIRFVAQRIDGKHVLAYLPGWEGRYYWQYGDFRPEPLLGGADGFARLCDSARELGVHMMPMFGGNCANSWATNFHSFGPSSYMKSASRNIFLGNQPDWDLSRAQDTGWQAWLNPGAPAWQNELVQQIETLIAQYGFDAVFLDTVEVWSNDPDFNIREGYSQIVARLRSHHRDLLITGEDWYDGLLGIFPIFQQSGNWRPVPDWVSRYVRLFGHIADGEASRGSTGVFEWGYNPYQPLPEREPYLTTLAFTDGTFQQAQAEVEAAIERAKSRL